MELIEPEESLNLDSKFLAKAVISLMKQNILERYKQTREVTDEDWEFCDRIDWHPVDELPLKESFTKELKEAKKGPFIKFNSAEELFSR